jgi:hypothetical protein
MIRCILLALIVLSGTVCAQTIDFTPRWENVLADGNAMKQLYFLCEGRKVIYRPPAKWGVFGSSDSIHLTPDRFLEAHASIVNGPAGSPVDFSEKNLEAWARIAGNLLPGSAENVTPLDDKLDAITINDWRGLEKSFSCTIAGRKFVRSILFVKLDARREIRVIVDAPPADFEAVHSAVVASLGSWFEPES